MQHILHRTPCWRWPQ